MKYLDPKNDLIFKRVFGEHKHLCMSLINSMLPLQKPIVSLEYTIEQLEAYYQRKIEAMTERGLISDALEKGRAIGLEKGEAIGLEKGRLVISI